MSFPYLKMPESVVLDESTYTNTFGRFTVQPLERGFGVTLGNSLRRVLLSSLTGAAITAIKVDGVLHEFSTIPGVVEDVTEIVLNLKQVRMKILNKKTNKLEISFQGPYNFTAADLQKNSSDIEILNPDLHIATLNKDAKFGMEIRFGTGKGYITSSEHSIPDQTIGLIPIDSIFTPIKNVRYDVENVRIGEKNDYEKLTLEITTDGSITPEDALTNSGKILRDHVQLFINFDVEQEEEKVVSEQDAERERIRKILTTSVDDLELSVRSHNCLKAANIKNLAELVRRDENEMLKFRNFGRKSLAELIEIVDNFGLEFGMDVDKYLNDKNDNS
ncbi:MAG: DNA-directed RNA polymerase subunit alpha [Syntrophomonadaceae bacterium]